MPIKNIVRSQSKLYWGFSTLIIILFKNKKLSLSYLWWQKEQEIHNYHTNPILILYAYLVYALYTSVNVLRC